MGQINEVPQPEEEQKEEGNEAKKDKHILGEVAGGVCLACTMVSSLCLFLVAMVNLT